MSHVGFDSPPRCSFTSSSSSSPLSSSSPSSSSRCFPGTNLCEETRWQAETATRLHSPQREMPNVRVGGELLHVCGLECAQLHVHQRLRRSTAGCFSSTKRGDFSICDLKLSPCIKASLCGSKQSGGSMKESEADSFSEGRKEARQQQPHHFS